MSRKKIDLAEVKAARKTLKEIASAHPELLGERSPENIERWESILAEDEVAKGKTTLVAFRFENELLKRIDAYVKQLEQETPGMKSTRAEAVRVLLLRALAEVEKARKQK